MADHKMRRAGRSEEEKMRPPGRKSNWPGPVGANPSEEEAQNVKEFCILANGKVHFELNVTRF